MLVLVLLAFLFTPSLATFGPTVTANWAGQFPYVVNFQNPSSTVERTVTGLVLSSKMALVYQFLTPATINLFTMTDYALGVHSVVKLVGTAAGIYNVVKTCKAFGPARFNLTASEFYTFSADTSDAAVIFFHNNALLSKSTTALSDANCDAALSAGISANQACVATDSTPGICTTYIKDAATYEWTAALVVQGRVQGFLSRGNCNMAGDNILPTQFDKIVVRRQDILGISGIVVDNP
ncbi:uncharacterized protein LOC132193961 [Neocloeon triangulifer]|uniref:uncharacterized protein LOC132193961 n=1 Tax=Neocloeon triangulifer TaxID=2078957 RepID=UPI00286F0788|nr:uncharacterized protein LOC132193961 [Neocloeon triangulifer]XP_059470944.1 uncharacterized protein LOC132193961 [Neocloeon triangulifer]